MIPADALDGFSHSNGQVWKSMDTNSLTVAGVYLAVEPTEFDLSVANLRRDKALESAQAAPAKVTPPGFSIKRKVKKPADMLPLGPVLAASKQEVTGVIGATPVASSGKKAAGPTPVQSPCVAGSAPTKVLILGQVAGQQHHEHDHFGSVDPRFLGWTRPSGSLAGGTSG